MLELRAEAGGPIELHGYAATFEQPYPVMGFSETIHRKAFAETLAKAPDVVLLRNHEGEPLARTTSGTLRLWEDRTGLGFAAELDPDDPDVMKIVPKLRRNDINEASFAFRATRQRRSADKLKRDIDEADIDGGDVSLVTRGANPNTTAALRASEMTLEQRERVVQQIGDQVCGPGYTYRGVSGLTVARRAGASAPWQPSRAALSLAKVKRARLRGAPVGQSVIRAARREQRDAEHEYTQAEKDKFAREHPPRAYLNPDGHGSYPILNARDLSKAIRAVGRGNPEHEKIRRYIMTRARALRLLKMIPPTWQADGRLAA